MMGNPKTVQGSGPPVLEFDTPNLEIVWEKNVKSAVFLTGSSSTFTQKQQMFHSWPLVLNLNSKMKDMELILVFSPRFKFLAIFRWKNSRIQIFSSIRNTSKLQPSRESSLRNKDSSSCQAQNPQVLKQTSPWSDIRAPSTQRAPARCPA